MSETLYEQELVAAIEPTFASMDAGAFSAINWLGLIAKAKELIDLNPANAEMIINFALKAYDAIASKTDIPGIGPILESILKANLRAFIEQTLRTYLGQTALASA